VFRFSDVPRDSFLDHIIREHYGTPSSVTMDEYEIETGRTRIRHDVVLLPRFIRLV
jgi:hypothetical protein